MSAATYRPEFFEVSNLEEAKTIILTPENGVSPAERWERETLPMANMIASRLDLSEHQTVIDYGCGIGRLAKELIKQTDCNIVGVDISRSMRAMASLYCDSEAFFSCPKDSLEFLVNSGFRANHAFSVWVLQHAQNPAEDIELIHSALTTGGMFLVINLDDRCLPTNQGWKSDKVDVKALIEKRFKIIDYFPPPKGAVTDIARLISFCGLYQKAK